MTKRAGEGDNDGKHLDIFNRRARVGQCFHMPCLGTREFPAFFRLVEHDEALPISALSEEERNRDLGWMLHDIDFVNNFTPRFFRAQMADGVIQVPAWDDSEVKS